MIKDLSSIDYYLLGVMHHMLAKETIPFVYFGLDKIPVSKEAIKKFKLEQGQSIDRGEFGLIGEFEIEQARYSIAELVTEDAINKIKSS